MALIKLGGIVTQISGKIGGQSLGTSASGAYIKNSGTPRKSITLKQQGFMQRMASTSQSWRNLSDAQRLVFTNASPEYPYLNRVGETKYYSGYAIYGMLKNNLTIGSVLSLPTPLPKKTFASVSTADFSVGSSNMTIQADTSDTGVVYRLFFSRPGSMGVTNAYRNQFLIATLTVTQLDTGINVYANAVAVFGPIPADSKIYWRLDSVDGTTGQSLKNSASGFINYT